MVTGTTHAQPMAVRRIVLGDHGWVSIRPIERSDAAGLSDFYARLSPESRRRRFLGASDVTDPRLIQEFAAPGEGVVGMLRAAGRDDGAVVAHASVQRDRRGGAEVAFAVADDLQGLGVGRALVDEIVKLARERHIGRVRASLYADNAPMRRLLRDAGCAIVRDVIEAGIEEIELRVAA